MSWQWPNIGSRVNREVHARFWERLGVKVPRATRHAETVTRLVRLVCIGEKPPKFKNLRGNALRNVGRLRYS
jgi:hypothetical protein